MSNEETNLHKQKYQLQSLANQILAIDEKLEELAAVRSPHDASIYRIKI